jgi:hypothetical protein
MKIYGVRRKDKTGKKVIGNQNIQKSQAFAIKLILLSDYYNQNPAPPDYVGVPGPIHG